MVYSYHMLIYVTGTIGAGKGEVVNYLVSHYGMKHYSFRQFFLDELAARGLPVDRPHMIDLADSIRAERGYDYVVSTLTSWALEQGGDAVIESIRNPGEVAFIKAQPDAHLLGVDADAHTRYERILARAGDFDKITYEHFLKDEEREMENADPWRTNLVYCLSQAEYVYQNNGTLTGLHEWIDGVIQEIRYGKETA